MDVTIGPKMTPVLELKNVTKRFFEKTVLEGIDWFLEPGETIALIGANGAGKTTLLEILSGNLDPTSGEVTFLGERLKQESAHLRRRVGYLPQRLELPPWASANDLLTYAYALHELQDETLIVDTLKMWDCYSFKDQAISNCSHGMQKRVALCLASMHNPDLLILDEPFAGLDILHAKALFECLKKRQTEQKVTLLSCHISPYIARSCSRVICIKEGRMKELIGFSNRNFEDRIRAIEQEF